MTPDRTIEKSEADKIVDGMEFGELCNEFECISSPSVEATARQLVRDILELRDGNRALGTYAVSVKYKVLSNTENYHFKRIGRGPYGTTMDQSLWTLNIYCVTKCRIRSEVLQVGRNTRDRYGQSMH